MVEDKGPASVELPLGGIKAPSQDLVTNLKLDLRADKCHCKEEFQNLDSKILTELNTKGINLDTIQFVVDKTKAKSITPEMIVENGLANKKDLIKILGRGELKSKINISAHGFSAKAKNLLLKI